MPADRNALTTATTKPPAARPAPPSWLKAWTPDRTPPATVEQIDRDLARMEAAIAPVDRMALVVIADAALSLFPLPANWEEQGPVWYGALADIPEDLIRLAFERVARNCTFWPRPAEVRKQISDELFERRVAVTRLKRARSIAAREAETEARLRRDAAARPAVAAPRMNRMADVPRAPDEIVVTPEEAAARVAEWNRAIGDAP